MSGPGQLLTLGLLGQLEVRWKAHGAPITANLDQGLSEAEIDRLTRPLGLRLPVEAKTWWGWHNGVPISDPHGSALPRMVGPGLQYLPLEEAIDLYKREIDLFHSEEISAPLRPRERFPIMYSGGPMTCDCSVPEGAPTPIYHVDSHDYDIDGVTNPRTQSFGEVVQWWIEALDDGTWRWDAAAGRWRYDYDKLDFHRSSSGLV